MILTDEDALICDFAETYHIYDYRSLPLGLAATLAVGLRADSRIMLKVSKQTVENNIVLLAGILDALNFLAWTKTEDAAKNQNRPERIVAKILEPPKEAEVIAFEDENDLLAHMDRIKKEARNARLRKSVRTDSPES